jgi:hypothetical protein
MVLKPRKSPHPRRSGEIRSRHRHRPDHARASTVRSEVQQCKRLTLGRVTGTGWSVPVRTSRSQRSAKITALHCRHSILTNAMYTNYRLSTAGSSLQMCVALSESSCLALPVIALVKILFQ